MPQFRDTIEHCDGSEIGWNVCRSFLVQGADRGVLKMDRLRTTSADSGTERPQPSTGFVWLAAPDLIANLVRARRFALF